MTSAVRITTVDGIRESRGATMAGELSSYDQAMCTVAATLTAASFGPAGGATAAITVLRYREILSELANGGGLQRGAPSREVRG